MFHFPYNYLAMDLDCSRQCKFHAPLPPLVAHISSYCYLFYLVVVTNPGQIIHFSLGESDLGEIRYYIL